MPFVKFTVLGRPQPQGSIRAFVVKGRPILTSDNSKLKPWRQQVGWSALEARSDVPMAAKGTAVYIDAVFCLQKPKSARKSEVHPVRKPDLDKMGRALLDSLTGILYEDDSQVCYLHMVKSYDVPERTEVKVTWDVPQ